jgi:O-antigen biosynthesis protein
VRLHGIGAVEDTLSALVEAVHAGDPEMLATYTNYPTTEYLHVAGQDLATFNVFLEDPDAYRRYLRHLQVAVGDIPLVLTEVGLAAEIHGEQAQADSLDWQLRILDETGCAGGAVYAWTDEWGVAGEAVEGWGFGITTADRTPKPAVEVVGRWARSSLQELRAEWPRVSVVVCAYNEERRLRECLASLEQVDYPDLEVIVCDDGSTDATLAIAGDFPFTVLALPHAGLSVARNAGLRAATGEIVAYLDADAACHPEWPYHLALSLEDPQLVATGGPNLPFADAPFVEHAVSFSPGSPQHVLVADDRAEHVPGCNMAFRKEALEGVGGFDAIYTAAGDDVDLCWRLLDTGGQIGFSPAAQIRHHRRDSITGYLKQQRGYGKSERMVAGRHRHRFNRLGQARWNGSIYGGLSSLPGLLRPIVYHGPMGIAPYQGIVARPWGRLLDYAGALLPLSLPVAVAGLVAGLLLSPWALLVPAFVVLTLIGYAVAAGATVPASQGRRMRATVGSCTSSSRSCAPGDGCVPHASRRGRPRHPSGPRSASAGSASSSGTS